MPLPTCLLVNLGGSVMSNQWFSRGSYAIAFSIASRQAANSGASRCMWGSAGTGHEWYSRSSGGY